MKRSRSFRACAAVAAVLLLTGCGGAGGMSLPLEEIGFANSAWLDQYMEQTLPAYGRDFTQSAAFSYSGDNGKFVLLYASEDSVEEIRDAYLRNGAEEDGRNDSTALALTAQTPDGTARIVNYYSGVCRMVEQELRTSAEVSRTVREQLESAFPEELAAAWLADTPLAGGEPAGGYVRYLYDNLDPYFQGTFPIFSRAYSWNESEDVYRAALDRLSQRAVRCSLGAGEEASYFEMDGGILSVSRFLDTDGKTNVSISFQITYD